MFSVRTSKNPSCWLAAHPNRATGALRTTMNSKWWDVPVLGFLTDRVHVPIGVHVDVSYIRNTRLVGKISAWLGRPSKSSWRRMLQLAPLSTWNRIALLWISSHANTAFIVEFPGELTLLILGAVSSGMTVTVPTIVSIGSSPARTACARWGMPLQNDFVAHSSDRPGQMPGTFLFRVADCSESTSRFAVPEQSSTDLVTTSSCGDTSRHWVLTSRDPSRQALLASPSLVFASPLPCGIPLCTLTETNFLLPTASAWPRRFWYRRRGDLWSSDLRSPSRLPSSVKSQVLANVRRSVMKCSTVSPSFCRRWQNWWRSNIMLSSCRQYFPSRSMILSGFFLSDSDA